MRAACDKPTREPLHSWPEGCHRAKSPSKFQHSNERLTVHFIDSGRHFMSGTIIEFRRYRNLKGHRRGAEAPLPYRPDRRARLDKQIARIEALLEELKEIGCSATDVAEIRDILAPSGGHSSQVQDKSDPQPQIRP